MLKKIHAIVSPARAFPRVLACAALALLPAPAALAEYKDICLFNQGAYTAGFVIEYIHRDGNTRDGSKSFHGGVGGVSTGLTKCASLQDAGLQPGDTFRFTLNPHLDIAGKGGRNCGANRDRARGHEGLFLVPDGPAEGRLTFKSWGGLYHTQCELEHSNTERMHSKCGETRNGMDNPGCNRFELDQKWNLGTTDGAQIAQAMEQDATLGQLYDLIDRGHYDVDRALNDGSAAVHFVAEKGLGSHLDLLIERGANLDAQDDHGATPLMDAITSRRFDMAEKLLNAGANPDFAREDGDFPLYSAAGRGNPDIVQALLNAGALVNAFNTSAGKSPLEVASERQDSDRNAVVNLLIRNGAENRVYQEEIPNIIAADAGLDKLARALDKGAEVNQPAGDGSTGLHIAAKANRGDYAEMLLARGADPDLQDDQGRTPLMVAIEAGPDYPAVVQVLLFEGANPNLGRNDWAFPLYLAVDLGLDSVIDMLLFYGRDVHVNQRHPNTGKTALGLAEEKSAADNQPAYQSIRESLLNYGAIR